MPWSIWPTGASASCTTTTTRTTTTPMVTIDRMGGLVPFRVLDRPHDSLARRARTRSLANSHPVAVRDPWQTAVMPGGWRPMPPKVRLLTGIRPGRDSGGRKVLPGLVLPPATPPEPTWAEWFPGRSAEVVELRETASAEWRRAVAVLSALKLLTALDGPVLADYAVCYARLVECERRVAADGLVVDGRRHPPVDNAGRLPAGLEPLGG